MLLRVFHKLYIMQSEVTVSDQLRGVGLEESMLTI